MEKIDPTQVAQRVAQDIFGLLYFLREKVAQFSGLQYNFPKA
jgi:hypothetical protein